MSDLTTPIFSDKSLSLAYVSKRFQAQLALIQLAQIVEMEKRDMAGFGEWRMDYGEQFRLVNDQLDKLIAELKEVK